MPFYQDPPRLANQYDDDRVLRSFLARKLPYETLRAVEPSLREMGALAAGPLYDLLLAEPDAVPTLTGWDAWGRRIDHIEPTRLWKEAAPLAARMGLIALAYERPWGAHSRLPQMALAYLLEPSSGVYSCPLAMTDGAARTLTVSGNRELVERACPRLTSRDPSGAWTSGQWMTERTGGSDVGLSETVAKNSPEGWRLFGTKWFTSATSSEMALTLGRPEGSPPGGSGLALFYVEGRDASGAPNGIEILRLKDKLGTRMVPTAELLLNGAIAAPVKGLSDGVKNIAPMLTITRMWNAVGAVAGMRRALALARDYASRRVAFGAPLAEKPLHLETLADLQALFEGAFHLTFRAVELVGRDEAEGLGESEAALLRLLTPIAKLTTGKQVVSVASESLECFGGAGYVENTGLPRLLRDAQVLPIWEGTTNVLSLDLLRAAARAGGLAPLAAEVDRALRAVTHPSLAVAGDRARAAVRHAESWLAGARDPAGLEAGARRLALTLGLALETALLVEHASWALENERDPRPAHAARRLSRLGVDRIDDASLPAEARGLGRDEPAPFA
ncbi:MAG: acyl-CoA dehydrogenase family protein [Thermoanaerobaculia bacterium]